MHVIKIMGQENSDEEERLIGKLFFESSENIFNRDEIKKGIELLCDQLGVRVTRITAICGCEVEL